MPRTVLTKTSAPGSYPSTLTALVMTAADTSNNNRFKVSGNDLVVLRSVGGSSTFTLTGAPDETGRSASITTEAMTSGQVKILGPFKKLKGWRQSDGYIYISGNSANLKIGVIALP